MKKACFSEEGAYNGRVHVTFPCSSVSSTNPALLPHQAPHVGSHTQDADNAAASEGRERRGHTNRRSPGRSESFTWVNLRPVLTVPTRCLVWCQGCGELGLLEEAEQPGGPSQVVEPSRHTSTRVRLPALGTAAGGLHPLDALTPEVPGGPRQAPCSRPLSNWVPQVDPDPGSASSSACTQASDSARGKFTQRH